MLVGFTFENFASFYNNTEFAMFVENGVDSLENWEDWMLFLEAHEGEFLEFDGTITDWYDDLFWISISFSIAMEDSEFMSFSKSTVEFSDLELVGDYSFESYHVGLITEGMRVHVVTEITQTEDGWELELCSMQILE